MWPTAPGSLHHSYLSGLIQRTHCISKTHTISVSLHDYLICVSIFSSDMIWQLMLAVAAHSPSNPEAQVVLGVLYNISQDFDNATECFARAIELSPPDYTLLNKVISRQPTACVRLPQLHSCTTEAPSALFSQCWPSSPLFRLHIVRWALLWPTTTRAIKQSKYMLKLSTRVPHMHEDGWT